MTKQKHDQTVKELQALVFIGTRKRIPSDESPDLHERVLGRAFAKARRHDLEFLTFARAVGWAPWKEHGWRTANEALTFFLKNGRRPRKTSQDAEERRLGRAWYPRVSPRHVLYDPKFVRAARAIGAY